MKKILFSSFMLCVCLLMPDKGLWKNQIAAPKSNDQQIGIEMVMIPAGTFIMGAEHENALADADEKPTHEVYLDTFWIDKTEISYQMYADFLNDQDKDQTRGYINVSDSALYLKNGVWLVDDDFADLPAVHVTWIGADAYCTWSGRRLPSEAEWEKAARGNTSNIYPSGDSINCENANFADCGGKAQPIEHLSGDLSPYGVQGMTGNVWEWVSDWYDVDYYKRPALYQTPFGPDHSFYRTNRLSEALGGVVIRGGSYLDQALTLRVTNRAFAQKNGSSAIIGFRCVLSPNSPQEIPVPPGPLGPSE